jgi:hypothetical protein
MMNVDPDDWDRVFEHLVIDDLREFDVPPKDADVVYFRTLDEALALLEVSKVYIKTLWLDFDLGPDRLGNFTDIKIFVHGLVGATLANAQEEYKWQIDNIYIITANPIGRAWMLPYLQKYLGPPAGDTYIVCLDPMSYGLINKIEWSTDA